MDIHFDQERPVQRAGCTRQGGSGVQQSLVRRGWCTKQCTGLGWLVGSHTRSRQELVWQAEPGSWHHLVGHASPAGGLCLVHQSRQR